MISINPIVADKFKHITYKLSIRTVLNIVDCTLMRLTEILQAYRFSGMTMFCFDDQNLITKAITAFDEKSFIAQ